MSGLRPGDPDVTCQECGCNLTLGGHMLGCSHDNAVPRDEVDAMVDAGRKRERERLIGIVVDAAGHMRERESTDAVLKRLIVAFRDDGLRPSETQPTPSPSSSRIPCNECDGRGWHIGECHPREECSGCAGPGDLLSDESLASMVKDFETCKPKYEQNAVEKREMAREILRLRAVQPMGQPRTATHPALLDLFFEVEQHIKKNSTLEMGGRKFRTPSIAKLADALAYARECTEQPPSTDGEPSTPVHVTIDGKRGA